MLCALVSSGIGEPIRARYGIPISPIPRPEVPIEDLNIPEQPLFVVPPEEPSGVATDPVVVTKPHPQLRAAGPIIVRNSYGFPATTFVPETPIQEVNIPEAPTLVVPQFRAQNVPKFQRIFRVQHQNGYGAPLVPVLKPETPIEEVNIPEAPTLVIPEVNPDLGVPDFAPQTKPHFRTVQAIQSPYTQQPSAQVFKPVVEVPIQEVNIPDGPILVQPEFRTLPVAVSNPGLYNYGYKDLNSAKQEARTADGITRGQYSYVDPNGILQQVQYIADPLQGYRVLSGVQPVQDTPEVAAAKAQFFKTYNEVLLRNSV